MSTEEKKKKGPKKLSEMTEAEKAEHQKKIEERKAKKDAEKANAEAEAKKAEDLKKSQIEGVKMMMKAFGIVDSSELKDKIVEDLDKLIEYIKDLKDKFNS